MKRLLAATAFALLVAPAAASAHPGVYTVTQKQWQNTANPADTCRLPDDTCIADNTRVQYSVANDGWAMSFTEGNNASPGRGLLNYKSLPGTWRGTDRAAILAYASTHQNEDAVTDLQAHATCMNAAWDTQPNILAWQEDPFFNYIPWQKTSAGLGDVPSEWMPLVKTLTGVDLSTLNTPDEFVNACRVAGGTYYPADVATKITTALETALTTPLQSEITTLKGSVAAETAKYTAAEAARQALVARPLVLSLSGKRTPAISMITGAAGTSVKVRVLISAANAKKLKIARTLATKTKTLDAQGAALFSLTPSAKVRKAIKSNVNVTVEAVGGGVTKTASGVYVG